MQIDAALGVVWTRAHGVNEDTTWVDYQLAQGVWSLRKIGLFINFMYMADAALPYMIIVADEVKFNAAPHEWRFILRPKDTNLFLESTPAVPEISIQDLAVKVRNTSEVPGWKVRFLYKNEGRYIPHKVWPCYPGVD